MDRDTGSVVDLLNSIEPTEDIPRPETLSELLAVLGDTDYRLVAAITRLNSGR